MNQRLNSALLKSSKFFSVKQLILCCANPASSLHSIIHEQYIFSRINLTSTDWIKLLSYHIIKNLLLSKKKQIKLYRNQNADFLQKQIFTAEHIIWLLHKSVWIQVNIATGHSYDIEVVGLTKKPSKSLKVDPNIIWINIEICNDTIEDRRRKDHNRIQCWRLWSDNTAQLWLTFIHSHYNIVDKTGSHIQATSVMYYSSFNIKKKCDAKTDTIFNVYEMARVQNRHIYSAMMKNWCKSRKQWEINLIEHKFFNCQNLKIFCSDITANMIRAAIFLTKKNNQWEDQKIFTDSLIRESLKCHKKMKTVLVNGMQLLATDSEQSDEETAEKQKRKTLKKQMILDKQKRDDIVSLIMKYAHDSERTEASLFLHLSHSEL